MNILIKESAAIYLDAQSFSDTMAKLENLPFAAETDGDIALMAYLENHYRDFKDWELIILFTDNLNSLINAKASTKRDNECSFLVRNKVLALAGIMKERWKHLLVQQPTTKPEFSHDSI